MMTGPKINTFYFMFITVILMVTKQNMLPKSR